MIKTAKNDTMLVEAVNQEIAFLFTLCFSQAHQASSPLVSKLMSPSEVPMNKSAASEKGRLVLVEITTRASLELSGKSCFDVKHLKLCLSRSLKDHGLTTTYKFNHFGRGLEITRWLLQLVVIIRVLSH